MLNIGIDQSQLVQLKKMYSQLVRNSDALRNERIRIEQKLEQHESTFADLQSQSKVLASRSTAVTECNEKLKRHMLKQERLPRPIGEFKS